MKVSRKIIFVYVLNLKRNLLIIESRRYVKPHGNGGLIFNSMFLKLEKCISPVLLI